MKQSVIEFDQIEDDIHGSESFKNPVEIDSESELLIVKYAPKNISELAVHKKKVSQVAEWLKQAFNEIDPKVLILLGPPGSGKTATIKALSHEMNFVKYTFTKGYY